MIPKKLAIAKVVIASGCPYFCIAGIACDVTSFLDSCAMGSGDRRGATLFLGAFRAPQVFNGAPLSRIPPAGFRSGLARIERNAATPDPLFRDCLSRLAIGHDNVIAGTQVSRSLILNLD